MNRPHVKLLAILALAGCSPPGSDAPVEPGTDQAARSANEAAHPLEAPLVSLVGEYRVAGIDGEPLDAQFGITVSIHPEIIELAPCASLHWSYTYADGSLETRRLPRPEGGIFCRISPEVQDAGKAIDVATSARRTAANGIELAGDGHSILLFSQ